MLLASMALLTTVASLAVAARWFSSRAVEAAVAACCVAVAAMCVPVLALGWFGALTRTNLSVTTTFLCVALLVSSVAHRDLRAHIGALARTIRAILQLPLEAYRMAWRERSLVLVGLIVATWAIFYTTVCAYLAPSSSWDGTWYHDAIVGFSLQNHGFALVDTNPSLEFVNGYPRTSEALGIWLVAFSDNRWIDVVPSLMAPLVLVAFYVVARRYADGPMLALAFALVLFLLPGTALQMRSTYVDLTFLSMFVAALHWVTRPELRRRDIVLAGVCLGLLGGMKGTGLVLVPPLTVVLVARAFVASSRKDHGRAGYAAVLGGALIVLLALMAPPYVRNWRVHQNPTWPVPLKNTVLGIDWKGTWPVDMPRSFKTSMELVYSAPLAGQQYHDARVGGYGSVPPFVLPPLVLFGFILCMRALVTRAARAERTPPERHAGNLALVLLATLPSLAFSPALHIARFNLHAGAALLLLCVWTLARPSLAILRHGIIGALIVGNAINLWWADPGWNCKVKDVLALVKMEPEERAAYKIVWYQGEPETMRALDRELGPGDVVAYTDEFGFPAVLWNESFTNKLVYVPRDAGVRAPRYLERLDAAAADWAVARMDTPQYRALVDAPLQWTRVGHTSDVNVAFRRTSIRNDGSLLNRRWPHRKAPHE